MRKVRSFINFLIGIVLFAAALYLVYYITQIIDFKTTTIIIKENPRLWSFMAYLPILMSMFIGALAIINGIVKYRALSIIQIILAVAVIVFIKYDLYGFVTIVAKYEIAMNYLLYAYYGAIALLVIEVILSIISSIRTKREVPNLEQE